MQNLSQILGEKRHYKKWLNEADLLNLLRRHSTELLGQLEAQIRIGFLQDGILILETEQYAWVNEINFFKPQLLDKINGILQKKGVVKDIKVRVQKEIEKKEESAKKQSGLSLEEKIKRDNKEKEESGWHLCPKCEKTYSPNEICLFCEAAPTPVDPEIAIS